MLSVHEVKLATSKKATNLRTRVIHDDENLLSAQEESVLRLKNGLVAEKDEVLSRKTNDPELLARLLELERSIINKAKAQKK